MYGENVHQDGKKEKDHPARRGTGTKNRVMELRTTQQTTKKKRAWNKNDFKNQEILPRSDNLGRYMGSFETILAKNG